jgi:hypothetical protein
MTKQYSLLNLLREQLSFNLILSPPTTIDIDTDTLPLSYSTNLLEWNPGLLPLEEEIGPFGWIKSSSSP